MNKKSKRVCPQFWGHPPAVDTCVLTLFINPYFY